MRTFRYSTILSIISIVTIFLPSAFSKERPSAKNNLTPACVKHYRFSKIHKDAHMWSAMFIASNGNIFIGLCTHADAANLYVFEPATEKMRHLANLTVLLGERGKGIWTNGKIHVRMQELDGFVYFGSFCEDNGPEGSITPLAQLCAPQYRGGDPFKVPHATLAMTISHKEKKIYYIPVMSGDFDYGAVQLDLTTKSKFAKAMKERKLPPLSFMVSYDLKTGQRRDIGTLRSDDGRYVYGLGAAETDSSGKIWFAGAFEEPDEDYVVRKISAKYPYSLGLGCYDPFQNKNH
ncbi:MAG: hypothetical protein DRP65_08370 [Planctomycetota bacterium]|nr:MAG: hypothetical protein DRP65_08370 [Planctomycetota bacterium]